jgi:hypothetical protein
MRRCSTRFVIVGGQTLHPYAPTTTAQGNSLTSASCSRIAIYVAATKTNTSRASQTAPRTRRTRSEGIDFGRSCPRWSHKVNLAKLFGNTNSHNPNPTKGTDSRNVTYRTEYE